MPFYLPHLARAHAELGQFEAAWRCLGEATTTAETTKETWCEAEIHRAAGEIALMSPEPDTAKAQAHFERAIAIARAQKAKSWELRAATSLARLWRDHNKRQQARDLLAPVYGWFTEGLDSSAVARSRQTAAGPRSSRAGLRLVHRRLRHRRPKRSQGAARRTDRARDCRRGVSNCQSAAPREYSTATLHRRDYGGLLRVEVRCECPLHSRPDHPLAW